MARVTRPNNLRVKHKEDKERLKAYFEKREEAGLGVPQDWRRKSHISMQTISVETGIPLEALQAREGLRSYVREWIIKIGFSDPVKLPPGVAGGDKANRELGRRRLENFEAYLLKLKSENKKLPEDPWVRGRPHRLRISAESGVPPVALDPSRRVGRRLVEAVAEIGLELRLDAGKRDALTYAVLIERGVELRKGELKGSPNAGAQLSNTKTALVGQFMVHFKNGSGASLTVDDVVGEEFNESFEEAVRTVTAKIENLGTRRKFATEIERWRGFYKVIFQSMALPSNFREALELLVSRAGLSATRLAELADGNQTLILNWLQGLNSPSPLSFGVIGRIEAVLGVAPKTLISLINDRRAKRFRKTDYPEHVTVEGERITVRGNGRLLALLRPLLPTDFNEYTEERRGEVAAYLIKNLIRHTTVWSRLNSAATSSVYRKETLPAVLNEELTAYTEFKRARRTPPGMVRNARWVKETAVMFEDAIKYLVGTLTNRTDAEDRRVRGLGLDENTLCFAMLANPAIIDKYLGMRGERRFDNWNNVFPDVRRPHWEEDQSEIYTNGDVSRICDIGSLFAPEYGWLRQRSDLVRNLKPIPGFIDERFIKAARKDWPHVCDAAHEAYIKLAKETGRLAEKLRDTFEPIAPILDLPNPMSALTLLSRNILDDMPDPSTAPFMAARHNRDYLITRIFPQTAFRSKQMRQLTYRKDNSGHLRLESGRYVIEVPYKRFKNWDSPFFGREGEKHDYRKELADVDDLYERLEEYCQVHRPALLRGNESDIFFVSDHRKPMFSVGGFFQNYQKLTMRYLAYNPYLERGIPGVKPHGPHTVRDIIATYVLKRTASYTLAAFAIHTTEEMVRKHYGRLFPEEKLQMVEQILREGLENM